MTHLRAPSFDLRPLRHPLFLVALAALVLNDHVLKGAGVAPAWLTGKLSDVAGLIVAPIVLATLLGGRGAVRRGLAFALVGGWFAAINLSPAAADATCALLGAIGLPSRIWVDPTDLVALAALPIAWHAMAQPNAASTFALRDRLALAVAIPACIATSVVPTPLTSALIHNDTEQTVELEVRWAASTLDCDAVGDRFADVLPPSAFGPATFLTLPPNHAASLDRDRDAVDFERLPADPPHQGGCEVALLRAAGMDDVVVRWRDLPTSVLPMGEVDSDEERDAVARGLVLRTTDDSAVRLVPADRYRLAAPRPEYTGGALCEDFGEPTALTWSDFGERTGERLRIASLEETETGCLALGLEDALGAVTQASLCVPREDFPFHENAEVQVWADSQRLRIVRDLQVDDTTLWRTGELTVVRDAQGWVEGPFAVSVEASNPDCLGAREACGGFRLPAAAALPTPLGVRYAYPGDQLEMDADDGRRAHLRVGRAEVRWATHPSCGDARLGASLDALIWYGQAPR